MNKNDIRIDITLPREVVAEIDRLAGRRRRRRFMTEAIQEKLCREQLLAALDATAGILKDVDIAHWESPEQTSAWVRTLRKEADESTSPSPNTTNLRRY